MTRADVNATLSERLAELENSPNQAVSVSAGLIRYCTASHMVNTMLPSGRSVTYQATEGEEIPSLPVVDDLEATSAITATTDAIAEGGEAEDEVGRGELLVPYVPWARRFYLPQWVPLDEKDHLLVNSAGEAEAAIASMQKYLRILHTAVSLAPYMVVDETYHPKALRDPRSARFSGARPGTLPDSRNHQDCQAASKIPGFKPRPESESALLR